MLFFGGGFWEDVLLLLLLLKLWFFGGGGGGGLLFGPSWGLTNCCGVFVTWANVMLSRTAPCMGLLLGAV